METDASTPPLTAPDLPNPNNPFSALGVALGLGVDWIPGAIHWTFAKGELSGLPVVILLLETPIGKIGLPFQEAGGRRFVEQFNEQLGGIEVARSIPDLGHPNGRHGG